MQGHLFVSWRHVWYSAECSLMHTQLQRMLDQWIVLLLSTEGAQLSETGNHICYTWSIGVYSPMLANIRVTADLLLCFSHGHGWKKLGSWKVPSWKIWVFRGNFFAIGWKFIILYMKICEGIVANLNVFLGNKHFVQLCS